MVETCLLISICLLAVVCVPLGMAAFPSVFSWQSFISPWSKQTLGFQTHGQKTVFPHSEVVKSIERLSSESTNRMAVLRRTEAAKSRLVEVTKIVQESPDTISIYLKPCGSGSLEGASEICTSELPSFKPGQHIIIHRPATSTQPAARRCYTLSGSPHDPNWRITVKDASRNSQTGQRKGIREASVSSWIHLNARVGDRFIVSGPKGRFTLDLASDTRPVILVAAGVGITPIASMLHHELQFGRKREKWVFYQVSDLTHAPLLVEIVKKIEAAQGVYGVVACSRENRLPKTFTLEADKSLYIVGGRLDAASIVDSVQTTDVCILICGPGPWMESMRSGFLAAGVASTNIFFESFGEATKDLNAGSSAVSKTIDITDGNPTATFSVEYEITGSQSTFNDSHENLLNHAKVNDVEIPSGCRIGNCGSCIVKLLKGTVHYKNPPESSLAADEILPCICVPTSNITVQA